MPDFDKDTDYSEMYIRIIYANQILLKRYEAETNEKLMIANRIQSFETS